MIVAAHRLFGSFGPDRLPSVEAEGIPVRPEATLRRILEFVGPDLEPEEWLREVARIPRPAPFRVAKPAPDERRVLTEACLPGPELLGYPV